MKGETSSPDVKSATTIISTITITMGATIQIQFSRRNFMQHAEAGPGPPLP